MNTRTTGNAGITLLEVMILMVVLAVIGFFLFQHLQFAPQVRSKRINCVNNLKQVGLATRMWAMDHGDTYPAATAVTNGGTLGHPKFHQPWIHYQRMSNELGTPTILVCPTDQKMKQAKVFGPAFGTNNVSYFMGVDAEETKPFMLLSGDRNLTTNGVRIGAGLWTVTSNQSLGWDGSMHKGCGNLGLADGSVQQMTAGALSNALWMNGPTNRLAIP